ncbi:unnamed protein product [Alopecurus aequalis]
MPLVKSKSITVARGLDDSRWARPFWVVLSQQQVREFVGLWTRLGGINLSQGLEDSIVWRWTGDGMYSARSAYNIQFAGSYSTSFVPADAIWKAKSEGKCRFFMWLLNRKRIYTADRLLARGWPCSATCSLCGNAPETADHLILGCPFLRMVWRAVARDHALPCINPPDSSSVPEVSFSAWWASIRGSVPAGERATLDGVVAYTAWFIWRERNSRIFENKYSSRGIVATLIRSASAARALAFARVVDDDLG